MELLLETLGAALAMEPVHAQMVVDVQPEISLTTQLFTTVWASKATSCHSLQQHTQHISKLQH